MPDTNSVVAVFETHDQAEDAVRKLQQRDCWLPGVGPVLVAGPLVALVVGRAEGAALGGPGALSAALAGIGIPDNSIVKYEADLKAGKLLLIAHGTLVEADNVKAVPGSSSSNGQAAAAKPAL